MTSNGKKKKFKEKKNILKCTPLVMGLALMRASGRGGAEQTLMTGGVCLNLLMISAVARLGFRTQRSLKHTGSLTEPRLQV